MSSHADVARTTASPSGSQTVRSAPTPGVLGLIAVPAVITLAVTLLRLYGELRGWNPLLFGSAAGGGGAILGIGWLMPVFGFWFGRRLALAGVPVPGWQRAILVPVAGVLCMIATFVIVGNLMGKDAPRFILFATVPPVCCLFAWVGWPQLARVNLCYGLAARLPILAVTAIAIAQNWGTHYEKLGTGQADMSDTRRTLLLCSGQLLFWVPATILFGGIAGGIAAVIARRSGTRRAP